MSEFKGRNWGKLHLRRSGSVASGGPDLSRPPSPVPRNILVRPLKLRPMRNVKGDRPPDPFTTD